MHHSFRRDWAASLCRKRYLLPATEIPCTGFSLPLLLESYAAAGRDVAGEKLEGRHEGETEMGKRSLPV